MIHDRWLVPLSGPPAATGGVWQLYGFPHAGGGTSTFANWTRDVAPDIELTTLCLPGRERHITRPPHRTMQSLVDELVPVLAPVVRPPYAFFGHSLGALVAFEVARALWRIGNGPDHLFASASRPPHVAGRVAELCALHDDALIAELTTHGGIPAGLAHAPDVLEIVLPPLRADLEVAAGYVAGPGEPLPCGITALGGTGDRSLDPEALCGWSIHTTGQFVRRLLPGDHFYLIDQRQLVLDAIRRDLTAANPHAVSTYQNQEARS